ncbi:helix-turn-helix domain-containing protein [Streptomyces abyssomicinicus]|uniref:helix-turn-helix domain-containing protein n=1 Tax=Streptomyces abyssomicinicus TaxID=574929 RepID=UPI0012508A51|nr:helix-turn-helix transcriptional regulator [Streptomyces abyssomicinicus]
MACEAEEPEPYEELFRAVGRQVKLLRERAGLTQRDLGDRLGYSEDLISSLERGRRTPRREFLAAADELLGGGGLLRAIADEVERAMAKSRVRHPAWFRDYARLEASAVAIDFYNNNDVPGLLQTEGRARALYEMRTPLLDQETIERRVASRLARQEILRHWPPPMVTAVVEEGALRRPLGGPVVHKEQLRTLLELARLRNVSLQVMPTERYEHAGMGGSFVLLTPKGGPQVAYVENHSRGSLLTEPEEIRILAARYGTIRAQALTPSESLTLIEHIMGAR